MYRNALLSLSTLALLALPQAGCKRAAAKTRGVGDSLQAFIVQNCETKASYCQVCKFGGQPTIMAVGDIDDEKFEQDLVEIQKIYASGEAKGLTAFAVVGRVTDGGIAPFEDEASALEQLAEKRARLGLTYPVVIIPKKLTEKQLKNYRRFNEAYALKGSRTILFAGADNKVTFATTIADGNAPEQFKSLADAVKKVL